MATTPDAEIQRPKRARHVSIWLLLHVTSTLEGPVFRNNFLFLHIVIVASKSSEPTPVSSVGWLLGIRTIAMAMLVVLRARRAKMDESRMMMPMMIETQTKPSEQGLAMKRHEPGVQSWSNAVLIRSWEMLTPWAPEPHPSLPSVAVIPLSRRVYFNMSVVQITWKIYNGENQTRFIFFFNHANTHTYITSVCTILRSPLL